MVLLAPAIAPAPMAVELFKLLETTSALSPIIVLLFPLVFVNPACEPK